MLARHMPLGFGFWHQTAGFDIEQALIPFAASSSTYGTAFFVGLLNTLLVAALGIVLATLLGFLIGIARLSGNFVVARLSAAYVEMFRNIPLLLQLLFWYNAILRPLPAPRQSLHLPRGAVLNNRGIMLPGPHAAAGSWPMALALVLAIALGAGFLMAARRSRKLTGYARGLGWWGLALALALPLATALAFGPPLHVTMPQLQGFNYVHGLSIYPELLALLLGLSLYTAAFIAEIVRAGIQSVARGQREAAAALGLPPVQILRWVVVPQALRVIIPPLTNQYLNLTKNSTLAVAIGYPDLAQVFMGTVLNQTGAAVQIVFITMGVYLAISLVTALAMNLWNRRMALHER
ncbi:MAG: ABC transporter permease subunit [Hyphomicrobiales bacterium]|nr:ABC transporter permease subunit [Hyphomicrobiales bacterium]